MRTRTASACGLIYHRDHERNSRPILVADFAKSPFVAAFFALVNASGHAAVYALNTPWIWAAGPDFDPSLTRDAIDPRIPGNFERYFAASLLDKVRLAAG